MNDAQLAMVRAQWGDGLADLLEKHRDHPWRQVGRCVWCAPCRARLINGMIPEGHPTASMRRNAQSSDPGAKMRERWGK